MANADRAATICCEPPAAQGQSTAWPATARTTPNEADPGADKGRHECAALPVKSFIQHFRDEFVFHIEKKACLHGTVEPKWGRAGARHEPHVVRNMAEAA